MSGDIEMDKCDFCKEIKQVERTYLYPSKYVKSEDLVVRNHLYNQGYIDGANKKNETAEQYYNETYGGQGSPDTSPNTQNK